jgi:hypothetical protein
MDLTREPDAFARHAGRQYVADFLAQICRPHVRQGGRAQDARQRGTGGGWARGQGSLAMGLQTIDWLAINANASVRGYASAGNSIEPLRPDARIRADEACLTDEWTQTISHVPSHYGLLEQRNPTRKSTRFGTDHSSRSAGTGRLKLSPKKEPPP